MTIEEVKVEVVTDDDKKHIFCKKSSFKKKNRTFLLTIMSCMLFISLTAFIVVSAITGLWHPMWTLILFGTVVESIFECILKKRIVRFAYPSLIAFKSSSDKTGDTINCIFPSFFTRLTIP